MQAQMEFGAPGGSVTRTDAGPALPGGMDPSQFATIMAGIYAQMPKPKAAAPQAVGMGGAGGAVAASRPGYSPGGRVGAAPPAVNDHGLSMLQAQAQAAQLQAMMAPPPMRLTYPMGSAGFYTPDINAMNAYQRQAYLPKESKADPKADEEANSNRRSNDIAAHNAWEEASIKARTPVTTGGS